MKSLSLRERQRLAGMREIQGIALRLFRELGFDAVTVEQIGEAAGVSPSTIYRYFATKERIVLWDEIDADIGEDLAKRLANQPPLEAVRDSFATVIADYLECERETQLDRVSFIYETPQLHAAVVERELANRAALAAGLAEVVGHDDDGDLTARVLAGACMAALDAAVDRWQKTSGAKPLADLVGAAFEPLIARSEARAKRQPGPGP